MLSYAVVVCVSLMVPALAVDLGIGKGWDQSGWGWRGAERGNGQSALAEGKSSGSNVAGVWGLRDEYGANEAKEAGAVGAAGIKDSALAAGGIRKSVSLVGRDSAYSDTGYRNVKGSVDTGRSTKFIDEARKAGIAKSAGSAKSRVLDVDRAEYGRKAQAEAVAGGVKNVGSLQKAEKAAAEINAASKGTAEKAGFAAEQARRVGGGQKLGGIGLGGVGLGGQGLGGQGLRGHGLGGQVLGGHGLGGQGLGGHGLGVLVR